MDMKRIRNSSKQQTDPENESVSRLVERKTGLNTMKTMGILVACLMILPVFVTISVIYKGSSLDQYNDARVIHAKGSEDATSKPVDEHKDKLASPHKPSSHLKTMLRKYEDLHRRCGPYTESYNKTVKKLKSGHHITSTDCNYVVWISYSGLGNRILTLASAFLYALLTDRVLLVDRGKDIDDLFCEPFRRNLENLLPEVSVQEPIVTPSGNRKSKAVLMTSLKAQFDPQAHGQPFGYVAQGLGGLKPWILYKPENSTAPDPPCSRAMSMEPCFHAPPFYDCKAKTGIDTGAIVPHVRHCEDMSWGLKLVDRDEL
ncbi:hypothetical protein IFM89_014212 [Coptis chinensis]|uniref:Fucosyltransferase n=1 Tax=Coptis chinensis TaxID=261450 RepID=A0A835IYY9_9MAGN|nr:hypothetical protein IFM89_014212 [Coptis chinensis]